jgi:hypothetical protein
VEIKELVVGCDGGFELLCLAHLFVPPVLLPSFESRPRFHKYLSHCTRQNLPRFRRLQHADPETPSRLPPIEACADRRTHKKWEMTL